MSGMPKAGYGRRDAMSQKHGGDVKEALRMVMPMPAAAASSSPTAAAPDLSGDGFTLGRPKRQRNSLAASALIPSASVSTKQLLGQ